MAVKKITSNKKSESVPKTDKDTKKTTKSKKSVTSSNNQSNQTNNNSKKANEYSSTKKGAYSGVNRTINNFTSEKDSKNDEHILSEKESRAKQTKAIILFLCSILIIFIIANEGENVWTFLHNSITGTLGVTSLVLPILLMFISIVIALERKLNTKIKTKVMLSLGIMVSLSTLIYVTYHEQYLGNKNFFEQIGNLYVQAIDGFGGGALSGLLGIPLTLAFGQESAFVVVVLALIGFVVFLFGITIKSVLNLFKKPVDKIFISYQKNKQEKTENRELKEQRKNQEDSELKKTDSKKSRQKSIFENDDFLLDDDTIKNNKKGINIDIVMTDEYVDHLKKGNIDTVAEKRVDLLHKVNLLNSNDSSKKKSTQEKIDVPLATFVANTVMENKKTPKKSDPEQLQPDPQTVQVEVETIQSETKNSSKNDNGYRYPPVELLIPNFSSTDTDVEGLHRDGQKLIKALESFAVRATVSDICKGPSVTRFEIQPAPGVKISRITSLTDDIALNLAATDGVRIEAPIPGKAAIGIEVPNKKISMVSMRELIDSTQFKNAKSNLTVVLGKDIANNIVSTDLSKMPHLLIAGTTGSGKSVCVNSILLSLLYKAKPNEVKLLLIDPKMVEFSKYKGIPHLLIPVVADVKKAAGALNWAVNEMTERYKTYAAYNVKDIFSYNNMVEKYHRKYADLLKDTPAEDRPMTEDGLPIPDEKMSQIVIAIDELADLMMTAPHEVEDSICRLAQKARACGMHLVIATQRPSVNVITGLIKANVPSRIALKTSSQIDSRTIIDVGGAEKLIGKGDMLFAPIGANKPLRVQGCYASEEEIENVTGYIKNAYKSEYNEEIVEEIEKISATQLSGNKSQSDTEDEENTRDVLIEEAIKIVVEEGQASTSLLQRKLRLGYARAGRIIDEMEQMGIVGNHEGSKPRKVLMTHQEWLERQHMNIE